MFCVCTAIPLPKIHYQIFLLKRHYRKENDIRDARQTELARAGDVKAGEKHFCEAQLDAKAGEGRFCGAT